VKPHSILRVTEAEQHHPHMTNFPIYRVKSLCRYTETK